jgi:DGQHR domain-containing protein
MPSLNDLLISEFNTMSTSPVVKTKKSAKKKIKSIRVHAFPITQSGQTFYLFSMRASQLWDLVQINRRSEDKKEGYQRALSPSRVRNIARFISAKGLIPGSIIVSFDRGEFSEASGNLVLPNRKNLGWVIDGQHRLAGAYEAKDNGVDPELPVVAFLKLKLAKQISLFVTINKEARSVPSSLYIDLLKHLPHKKTEKEITDERIADITRNLDADEESPFHQSIAFTRQAAKGEISLVNFARVLRPHLSRQAGVLGLYTEIEQEGAINNYFRALQVAYPELFKKDPPIFFKTVGFGAVWRAFPFAFNLANTKFKSVSVASFAKVFSAIKGFNFEAWDQLGTGTAAEIQAGDDLVAELQEAFTEDGKKPVALKLVDTP